MATNRKPVGGKSVSAAGASKNKTPYKPTRTVQIAWDTFVKRAEKSKKNPHAW